MAFEALHRFDFAGADFADECFTGSGGNAVHEDGAGGALTFAATVFATSEVEIVAENAEQGALFIRVNPVILAIYMKLGDPRHKKEPGRERRRFEI